MKYIIEIPDDVQYVLLNGKADNKYYTAVRPIAELEELNSDYINEHYGELQDEAYQRGYDDGYEAGCATAFKPVSDAEYQRGMDDAMSAFKKLYSCGWERDWKAMGFEFNEGEWSTSFEYIIGQYTASEIVEKVKAYDDKHSDRIEVGDEVRFLPNDRKGIVTACHVPDVYAENDKYAVFCGTTVEYVLRQHITKTGKHYDIQSILGAMKS